MDEIKTAATATAPAKPVDRLTQWPKPASAFEARTRLLELMRRDLIGPHPDLDPDLARELEVVGLDGPEDVL